MEKIEIFITDLKEEVRKEIEAIIGTDHNYDVFPIATLEIEKEE